MYQQMVGMVEKLIGNIPLLTHVKMYYVYIIQFRIETIKAYNICLYIQTNNP